jgi:EAL domain-containing protein (putative c-di-GMP-specific phosphodiesterase class I)
MNLKVVLDEILVNPTPHIKLNSQRALSLQEKSVLDEEIFAGFIYQGKSINSAEIFAIASQYQLSGELDLTILRMLLSYCAEGALKNKKIAVNLSRLTLSDEKSMNDILSLIKSYQNKESLIIGLPESAIIGNVTQIKQYIDQLTDQGCEICINRFGASMASLSYLMEIRPNQVKLSTSFTRAVDQKSDNAQMISAFVRMVHGLDINVIAQCVETENELKVLSKLKVDAVLGYIINKPKQLI